MIHGVLDQRLQKEQRHADLQQPRLDVDRDGESVAESYPQDVEIRLENGELLSQGDFLDILVSRLRRRRSRCQRPAPSGHRRTSQSNTAVKPAMML